MRFKQRHGAYDARRVRVRRDRPTALTWALALAVTMLAVYALTLDVSLPRVVESVSAAPRVTREIRFSEIRAWLVSMAECATPEEARLTASGLTARGAAGYVAEAEGVWQVFGALYEKEKDARRIAERLKKSEGIEAGALSLSAPPVRLRITASEAQIEAISGADVLLGEQLWQLGDMALQLDRGELKPDGARTLTALACRQAREAAGRLEALSGAGENRLCDCLREQLEELAGQLETVSDGDQSPAALSGMLRCAQIDAFMNLRAGRMELTGQVSLNSESSRSAAWRAQVWR